MADYSVQATSLAPPQGAGTQPIQPTSVIQPIQTGLSQVVGTVSEIIGKEIVSSRKAEAEERKNAVIRNYVTTETTINDAVASGSMSASEASARSRSNFNKHAAGYGEYIQDFEKAGKALRGFTESGVVEEQLKTEKDIRAKDIAQAQTEGYIFPTGMSLSAQNSQIFAVKSSIRAKNELDALYKRHAEERAVGTYNDGIARREESALSVKLINEIAGTNITAFQDFNRTIGAKVRDGSMTPEEAASTLNSRYSNISATIQAAAGVNPQLAAPYRTLFEDIYKIGQKLIDPKEKTDALENELKQIQTKMKLVAMQDPKLAATVIANQLLPNNPTLALTSAPQGIRAIAILSEKPVNDPGFVPQVVGDPEVEKDTLDLLKGGLASLAKGRVSNKEIAIIQASNSANHILKQTGAMIDKGASPTELKGVAAFFASPEYASFISMGKIDAQAAGAAKKTLQILYEPAIRRGVQERFAQELFTSKTEINGKQVPTTVGEIIDIKFSGSGIVFGAIDRPGLSPAERRTQRIALDNLKSAQAGINQIIHIGAHMEGSTDYAKFWEDNKHVYLPGYFLQGVNPGDVRNGYQYIGGNASVKSNWRKVQNAGTD